MADYPDPSEPHEIIGLREVCKVNGRQFSRRRGTEKWVLDKAQGDYDLPPAQSDLFDLSLVLQDQGGGQPDHWSLFINKDTGPGAVYQVKGDAEFMRHMFPEQPVDILHTESFLNFYTLSSITPQQAAVVREVAANEPPPRAPNKRSVTENCQGWVVRVLAKLVALGIVAYGKLEMVKALQQPL